jgi:hypothetical protein
MLAKIKTILSTSLVFIAGILGFIAGIFFYGKYMDKPETQVNNETNVDIGKIKSKTGNVEVSLPVETKESPAIVPVNASRKKFNLFKKKSI